MTLVPVIPCILKVCSAHRHHTKNRLISGCHKHPLEEQALIASTKQNLTNPLFLDIYGSAQLGTDIYSSF
jgi:hypothetical protein